LLKARLSTAVVTAALGAGLLIAPSATAAEPASVSSPATAKCNVQGQHALSWESRATTTVKYRSGPSTSCAALGQIASGTPVWIWDFNADGSWAYGRIGGTNTRGWFAAQYLRLS
jgi:uncharacterized protein YraI